MCSCENESGNVSPFLSEVEEWALISSSWRSPFIHLGNDIATNGGTCCATFAIHNTTARTDADRDLQVNDNACAAGCGKERGDGSGGGLACGTARAWSVGRSRCASSCSRGRRGGFCVPRIHEPFPCAHEGSCRRRCASDSGVCVPTRTRCRCVTTSGATQASVACQADVRLQHRDGHIRRLSAARRDAARLRRVCQGSSTRIYNGCAIALYQFRKHLREL